jgi:hypothetical protein
VPYPSPITDRSPFLAYVDRVGSDIDAKARLAHLQDMADLHPQEGPPPATTTTVDASSSVVTEPWPDPRDSLKSTAMMLAGAVLVAVTVAALARLRLRRS